MRRCPPAIYVLSALCEGFDVQAAGVAAAGLVGELHCTPAELGLFFTASGVGLMIGSVVGGHIADRLGRKLVLITSIGVFGAFSMLTALMPSLPLLAGARFLTGLGLGGAIPSLITLAAENGAPGARNRSVGVAYVGMPIGGSLASVLAFLIPSTTWRALFWTGGLAPLLIVPALMYFLPDGGRDKPPFSPARVEATSTQQFFGKGQRAQTLLLWNSFLLIVLTLHLMLNWLPFLLTSRGLSKDAAMLAQAAFGTGGALIALGQATLLDSSWRSRSTVISVGALPIILACAALVPARPGVLIFTALLLGGSILAQQVIAYSAGTLCYSRENRGAGLGAAVAAGRAGSIAGPLFATVLLAGGRDASQVLLGVLPIVLACGACVYLASRRCLR